MLERVESEGEPVRHVGVLRRDPQRSLLTAAADEDLRTARLDRSRHVERLLDPVVRARERRALLGEHRLDDRERFLQPIHPLADRREVVAIALVLDLVPGGAEAEDRPPAGDGVERRDLLGQQRRIAVRDARDERAQPHARGLAGEGGEHRPALEHRLVRPADAVDLVEVVHDRDDIEAGRLGGLGLLDDAVEQLLRRGVGVGVGGEVETEPDAHLLLLRRER